MTSMEGDIIMTNDDLNVRRGFTMQFKRGDMTIEGVITKRYKRRDGSVHLWWQGEVRTG